MKLDNLKGLLLRHFVPVLAVTVFGVTAVVQTPRLFHVGRRVLEARKEQMVAMSITNNPPAEEEIVRWEKGAPAATLQEPPRFLVALRQAARVSGCRVGDTSDGVPTAVGEGDLSSIDQQVKVSGKYEALLSFMSILRRDARVLAVTRANITAEKYPQLEAELTVRRYIRRSSVNASASVSASVIQ